MEKVDTRRGRPPHTDGRGNIGNALIAAAVECFRTVGYHGSTMRDIAAAVGVTPAAVYHHYPSKQAILSKIMLQAMQENVGAVTEAAKEHEGDPAAQLPAVVGTICLYHTEHPGEAFIGNTELRSLEDKSRSAVVQLRDREEKLLTEIIAAGTESGAFDCEFPKQAARAIIAMASSVANWFRPDGPLTAEEVRDQYVTLAMNMVRTQKAGGA